MFSTPNSNMACGLISTEYFNSTFQDSVVLQQQDPLVGLGGGGRQTLWLKPMFLLMSIYIQIVGESSRQRQLYLTVPHFSLAHQESRMNVQAQRNS